MRRKERLVNGEIYHVYNRSIADFKIFNNNSDFLRMRRAGQFYQVKNISGSIASFLRLEIVKKNGFEEYFISLLNQGERIIQIIAYCFMPTHAHFIIKQLKENGISNYMSNILNSYARYFNIKHNRKGPLWEGRFKNVLVKTDEQLLYLTRYIHLNPVTAYLVNKPENWRASSYREYISVGKEAERICDYNDILEIRPRIYKKFVEDGIFLQRELAKIKKLLLEEPNKPPGSVFGIIDK